MAENREAPEAPKAPQNTFHILRDLVRRVACKPGWIFHLVDEGDGLRLRIVVPGMDSYDPKRPKTIAHYFPVPTTTFNEKSWRRWMFEQCRRLENHELGEWFRFGNERPFEPLHGPGEDPYTVHEYRDYADALIVQDGSTRKHPDAE